MRNKIYKMGAESKTPNVLIIPENIYFDEDSRKIDTHLIKAIKRSVEYIKDKYGDLVTEEDMRFSGTLPTVAGQLVDDTENWYAAQDRIYAQIDRLGDAIPYGLYWQIPTDKLEKMTIEDAREWTRNFHSTPGKRANSTNLEVAASEN